MNWKSFLTSNPIEWLLEEDNPSVRYFTLKDILNKPCNDFEVEEAKKKIMETGVVPKILAKQEKNGYWGTAENFYMRAKYKGTSWQFIILAELAANPNDDRIKRSCQFILENAQDSHSGAFSYICSKNGGGDHERVLPCLTANMVWCLIRFGYLKDTRIQKAIDWIIKYQRFDDEPGNAPNEWPYKRYKRCWGERTCHSIIVKSLKVFSEIPENERTPEMGTYISRGAEHMLNHNIYQRSGPPSIGRFKWLEFGFPLFWNVDTLEVLSLLTKLGYKDMRMQDALDIMISKQNDDGKWLLENSFNGRVQVAIERKGKPSKWITLNALRVLKGYYG
jgi:hypothetical protein